MSRNITLGLTDSIQEWKVLLPDAEITCVLPDKSVHVTRAGQSESLSQILRERNPAGIREGCDAEGCVRRKVKVAHED